VAVDVSVLSKRFSERSLTTKMLSVEYLNFRLNPKRLESFNRAFASHTHKANRDFMPYAVFVFSLLRSKEFSPSFALWQESIINHRRLIAVIVVFFCVICVLWLRNKHKKYFYFSTTVAIATTGFVAMLITLILLFSFQVIFGYIYHQLGFLISLFMAGTALGAACVSWSKYSIDRYYHYLVITELAIMLACLGVACALVWFSTVFLLPFSFPTLFVMFGILVGCEFSLAGALYSFRRQAQGGIAGTLYAADLIGGWVAGVLGSTFLLTFVGLPQTCFLMAGLKLANFALLAHKKAGTR
ncbi:MAG: hypothetical protein KBA46_08325, partial [Candidatus Omnitrophica bacterium]|nr:hypothetical protein [Candidatus Omnitrophota bacterium]